jgi:hypothetical protein
MNGTAVRAEGTAAAGDEPTTDAKPKRSYTRRSPAAAGPAVGAVTDAQNDKLVLGFFSTGVLVIEKGKQVMHLSVEERGKLAHFLELVAP